MFYLKLHFDMPGPSDLYVGEFPSSEAADLFRTNRGPARAEIVELDQLPADGHDYMTPQEVIDYLRDRI
jgi:hypothetical protein